jgi:hypothetical protein
MAWLQYNQAALASAAGPWSCPWVVLLLFPPSPQEKDPILSHYEGSLLASPELIISLALGSLYASFVCFAQSVRLYVHTVSAAQRGATSAV